MNDLFVYALKSAVCLSVLYIPFYLLLRKETFFRLNRMTLLSILVASLLMPLADFTLPQQMPVCTQKWLVKKAEVLPLTDEALPAYPLQDTGQVSSLAIQERPRYSLLQILVLIYVTGVLVMTARFTIGIVRMRSFMAKGCLWASREDGVTVYCHAGRMPSFSWMNYIVISEEDQRCHPEVLLHERAHVHHGHSWDNLLLALCQSVQWFNPFVWLLAASLSDIHEYEADADVLRSGRNRLSYLRLLVSRGAAAKAAPTMAMTNGFSRHSVKHRVKMACRQPSRWWMSMKSAALLPAMMVVMMFLARPVVAVSSAIIGELPLDALDASSKQMVAEAVEETVQSAPMPADRIDVPVADSLKADAEMEDEIMGFSINPTFNATFPGGEEALEAYLNTQMGALSAELQLDTLENLYVKFWVLKDGRLDFIEVLSAVDETVTQQLTRIISEMPRWNPASHLGEKRASEVILPIKL